jgi:flagellar protein FliO/FliZ
MIRLLPIALLSALLVPPMAIAAQAVPERSSIVDAGYVVQFLLALGLVLGAIFALMYLLRRLNQLPGRGAAAMRVIGGLALGAREKLVLVQVGDKQLLLGMAPGQLRTLHVFDQPIVLDDDNKSAGGFASVLTSLASRRDKS